MTPKLQHVPLPYSLFTLSQKEDPSPFSSVSLRDALTSVSAVRDFLSPKKTQIFNKEES